MIVSTKTKEFFKWNKN